jgi:hypothetical protein
MFRRWVDEPSPIGDMPAKSTSSPYGLGRHVPRGHVRLTRTTPDRPAVERHPAGGYRRGRRLTPAPRLTPAALRRPPGLRSAHGRALRRVTTRSTRWGRQCTQQGRLYPPSPPSAALTYHVAPALRTWAQTPAERLTRCRLPTEGVKAAYVRMTRKSFA